MLCHVYEYVVVAVVGRSSSQTARLASTVQHQSQYAILHPAQSFVQCTDSPWSTQALKTNTQILAVEKVLDHSAQQHIMQVKLQINRSDLSMREKADTMLRDANLIDPTVEQVPTLMHQLHQHH